MTKEFANTSTLKTKACERKTGKHDKAGRTDKRAEAPEAAESRNGDAASERKIRKRVSKRGQGSVLLSIRSFHRRGLTLEALRREAPARAPSEITWPSVSP